MRWHKPVLCFAGFQKEEFTRVCNDSGERAPGQVRPAQVGSLKVIGVVSLGGFLELYDFIIYAMMAGYIADHFFPTQHEMMSLLLVFSSFSAGYLVRPLGGIVFGHIGDRYGRKVTFAWSVLLMAGSTLCMALLPGYSELGVLAPALLIGLRLIQGFSLGGEIPGAITYLRETQARPGLAGGTLFMALMLGVAGASCVHAFLLSWLGHNTVAEWGWRLAFVLGGSLGFISFYIRRRFQESPAFLALVAAKQHHGTPAIALLRNHRRALVTGILVMGMTGAVATVLLLFGPSYYTRVLGYSPEDISFAMALYSAVVSPLCLLGGWLCDRIEGRKLPVLMACLLIAVVMPLFAFWMEGSHSAWVIALPAALMGAFYTGVIPVFLATLFPAPVRYSGIGITYNVGMTVFGGMAPPCIMAVVELTGDVATPGYYLTLVGCIGLVGALALKNKTPTELSGQTTG
ncbi:MFS transporter [Sansalvadorimonas verongulae]|uniref:MFS transporter n=1 Tax=Sansalvadorimonas verongulae TaxID=2172824 RepID=UPI0012BCE974|nr:MFS transporter [Sansalvadorimonas verongulae]MTI14572.1 MFS transporter [Sansalvadorimonas verongulae]